jgi:Na+/proline symporter
MSAYSIGVGRTAELPRPAAAPSPTLGEQLAAGLGALVKWLPAEVVGGYAAAVVAMQPEQGEGQPPAPPDISWTAWIIALVATPILVFLVAKAVKNNEKRLARVGLSIPAFALWSASIPNSVWEKLDAFSDNRRLFLLGLLFVVSGFTYLAQLIVPDS